MDEHYKLTPAEREFTIKALTEAVNLQGTFASLVPTMNMIETIVRKLSTPDAPKGSDETTSPDNS